MSGLVTWHPPDHPFRVRTASGIPNFFRDSCPDRASASICIVRGPDFLFSCSFRPSDSIKIHRWLPQVSSREIPHHFANSCKPKIRRPVLRAFFSSHMSHFAADAVPITFNSVSPSSTFYSTEPGEGASTRGQTGLPIDLSDRIRVEDRGPIMHLGGRLLEPSSRPGWSQPVEKNDVHADPILGTYLSAQWLEKPSASINGETRKEPTTSPTSQSSASPQFSSIFITSNYAHDSNKHTQRPFGDS